MRKLSVVFFGSSIVALGMGLYKMFAYNNSDSYIAKNVNSYVGGDAYNYIINGTHATAYFVLFGSLLVAGMLAEILFTLRGEEVSSIVAEDSPAHKY